MSNFNGESMKKCACSLFVEADIVLGVAITWIDNGSTKFHSERSCCGQQCRTCNWGKRVGRGNYQWDNYRFEGLFTLQDVPSKANLVISFIGYKPKLSL